MNRERFSFLLLEDGELLLEDFSAICRGADEFRGWIKICTKNLYFDPDDTNEAIWKFPFENFTGLDIIPTENHGKEIVFASSVTIVLRANGEDHAHQIIPGEKEHRFLPLYRDSDVLLKLCQRLRSISGIPNRQPRAMALSELVEEYAEASTFDVTAIQDPMNEHTVVELKVRQILPLSAELGSLRLTNMYLYFMPSYGGLKPMEFYSLSRIISWRRLSYGASDNGLEIQLAEDEKCAQTENCKWDHAGNMSLMFVMNSSESRLSLERELENRCTVDPPDARRLRESWQAFEISNYEYIMGLNYLSGRTFCDLSQYPVFPWILSNYTDSHCDIRDPEAYRDLSLPVGALSETRLDIVRDRFKDMPEPRFQWGTHYSSAGAVIFFLFRVEPSAMLKLQSGSFDKADRLFYSIAAAWSSATTSTTDVKELIPEFFAVSESDLPRESCARMNKWFRPGDFLKNSRHLDLGVRQDGQLVHDVLLPVWAKDSEDFIRRNREALESEFTSQNLHEWIDLIFGYKSANAEYDTLFLTDVTEYRSDDGLVQFGRTPKRLFSYPHPQRRGQSFSPMSKLGRAASSRKLWYMKKSTGTGVLRKVVPVGEKIVFADAVQDRQYAYEGDRFLRSIGRLLIVGSAEPEPGISIYDVAAIKRVRWKKLTTRRTALSAGSRILAQAPPIAIQASNRLIFATEDSRLVAYDTVSGAQQLATPIRLHADQISALCAEDSFVVSASSDALYLWQWNDKVLELYSQLDTDSPIGCVSCKAYDSQIVVAATLLSGNLAVWSVAQEKECSSDASISPLITPDIKCAEGYESKLCLVEQMLIVVNASGGIDILELDLDASENSSALTVCSRQTEDMDGTAVCVAPVPNQCTCLVGTTNGYIEEHDLLGSLLSRRKVAESTVTVTNVCSDSETESVCFLLANGLIASMQSMAERRGVVSIL